jgi:hypothetical protein
MLKNEDAGSNRDSGTFIGWIINTNLKYRLRLLFHEKCSVCEYLWRGPECLLQKPIHQCDSAENGSTNF